MKKNRVKHPSRVPFMLYADEAGNIMEDTRYEVMGRTGREMVRLTPTDFIPLPEGSEIFFLVNRNPWGYSLQHQRAQIYPEGFAVSAFIAPAHTQTYLSAYANDQDAPVLPLYAYTAVGWLDDEFYTTAVRVDADIRQDVKEFDLPDIEAGIARVQAKYPENRLVNHLANQCAMSYHCRAAQNYFLNRWECPIPSSPACNSACLGCISLQPEEHQIHSSHFRLQFKPDVKEIVEVAVDHLETVDDPIISFGQGCEGEPLLVADVLEEAIREIRCRTKRGIININTNGSRPQDVERLCKAGLKSIRVSMNSAQEEWYNPYYLPRNYSFGALKESLKLVRQYGGWASINYFVYPGLTDSLAEYQALAQFIRDTNINMIQWRNFNIDPDWYLEKAKIGAINQPMGVRNLLDTLKTSFPHLAYGYFNPSAKTQEAHLMV